MGGIPAPDCDLTLVGVVEGFDWRDGGSAGVSGARLDHLSPESLGDLLDSLSRETKTKTRQYELPNETERKGAEVRAGWHMPSATNRRGAAIG